MHNAISEIFVPENVILLLLGHSIGLAKAYDNDAKIIHLTGGKYTDAVLLLKTPCIPFSDQKQTPIINSLELNKSFPAQHV